MRKYCGYSGAVYAGSLKPGRRGEKVPCPGCGKIVKLRIPPRGDILHYVQIPHHNKQQPPQEKIEEFMAAARGLSAYWTAVAFNPFVTADMRGISKKEMAECWARINTVFPVKRGATISRLKEAMDRQREFVSSTNEYRRRSK
jgi:uncharacterized protein YoaH (UPF0181 family)